MSLRTRLSFHLPKISTTAKLVITPLSFLTPILTLLFLDPNSFQAAWQGRAPYMFFLWLFLLELILSWKKLTEKQSDTSKRFRVALMIITAAAPMAYVVCVFFMGLRYYIVELGKFIGLPWGTLSPDTDVSWVVQNTWPMSLEFILFTAFFAASLLLMYGGNGLKRFSVSMFFLGATGAFFMIDTFYPYWTFTILQAFAPVTASAAVNVLNFIGYKASWAFQEVYGGPMPVLDVQGLKRLSPPPAVGWPCAGIHSLFIYTFTILLFLKDAPISTMRKIIYIVIGAIGTFLINVLRVVSYCIIGVNSGQSAAQIFHSYYGELYFIAWIIIYPLAIIYGPRVLEKLPKFRLTKISKVSPTNRRI